MRTRTVSLTRAGQKFVFRYLPGQEKDVLDEIVRIALDLDGDLDMVDAMALCCQVAVSAEDESAGAD
ncbi:MAG: hypothetical protein HZA50_11945 [Planctomycetes bacterium]|nr:hypothetical protein [Planctomycetota bacterium]